MDAIDRRLVALLQADARLGYQELGEAVGLSAPAAYQRVRKLETLGVISGYHARVDAEQLGRGVVVFLRVEPGAGTDVYRLEQRWAAAGEILECHRVSGAGGYLVKLRVRSVSDAIPHLDAVRKAGCAVHADIGLAPVLDRWTVPVSD